MHAFALPGPPNAFFRVVSVVGPIVCSGPDRSMPPAQSRGTASANMGDIVLLTYREEPVTFSEQIMLVRGSRAEENPRIRRLGLVPRTAAGCSRQLWELYFSDCYRIRDDMPTVSLSEYYGLIPPLMPQAHLDRNLPLAVARFLRVTLIHCRGSDSGPRYERLLWVAFASRFCESRANCVLLNAVITTLLIVSQQHRAR
jgi:hypothetical protein